MYMSGFSHAVVLIVIIYLVNVAINLYFTLKITEEKNRDLKIWMIPSLILQVLPLILLLSDDTFYFFTLISGFQYSPLIALCAAKPLPRILNDDICEFGQTRHLIGIKNPDSTIDCIIFKSDEDQETMKKELIDNLTDETKVKMLLDGVAIEALKKYGDEATEEAKYYEKLRPDYTGTISALQFDEAKIESKLYWSGDNWVFYNENNVALPLDDFALFELNCNV